MIRTLSILAALPCLTACDIGNFLNPGSSSKAAYEYRASIMATGAPATPENPKPTQVAEIPVPAAVDVPEPVYVAPEHPEPYVPPPRQPDCIHDLYAIYRCVDGVVVMFP